MLSALALALLIAPNDGVVYESGTAVNFGKHTSIQMVEEDVNLRIYDERTLVDVRFLFKNHGQAATVLMGFPDRGFGDVSDGSNLKNFKSTVDGKAVKVEYRKLGDDLHTSDGVWVKSVAFQAGQSRVVRVTYESPNGGSTQGNRSSHYIFETGATWSGNIEWITVTVDWSGVKNFRQPLLAFLDPDGKETPAEWTWAASKAKTTTLKDVKPNFNLVAQMPFGFWRISVNGKPIDIETALLSGYWGPIMVGGNVLVPSESASTLGLIFSGRTAEGGSVEWMSPVCEAFGGEFTFANGDVVVLSDGRRIPLARKAMMRKPIGYAEPIPYVYLRDVITALGGSISYDSRDDRVEIWFRK